MSVNEGPGEIANVFLGAAAQHKDYDKKKLRKLRQVFGRFLSVCGDALKLNADHIGADQFDYQENLKESFERMRILLVPLISSGRHWCWLKERGIVLFYFSLSCDPIYVLGWIHNLQATRRLG